MEAMSFSTQATPALYSQRLRNMPMSEWLFLII